MDTILIVDDEASVRATLSEWLADSTWELEVLIASDAASALELASRQSIDLAILDWNLGAGLNGLQLLEDLHEFQRELVAILITGYAHKATPLDALRLGVRDYLDKNHELNRERFLTAVRKQLDWMRPLKRERLIHQQMQRFRAVVAEALPRLETASVLHQESINLDQIVSNLMNLAMKLTGATAGLLIVRQFTAQNTEPEQLQLYDQTGRKLNESKSLRFAQSLAAAIGTLAPEPLMTSLSSAMDLSSVLLIPAESSHQHMIGIALHSSPSLTVVLELFDKAGKDTAFQPRDRGLLIAWQPMASVLLRMVLGERESQKMLYETLQAALQESDQFAGQLQNAASAASQVFTSHVKQAGGVEGNQVDQWAEMLQRLTQRYGPDVVDRMMLLLGQVEGLLEHVTHLPAS